MKLITVHDANYVQACLAWNRAVTKLPDTIAFCTTENDIIEALAFAKKRELPIKIRSGRHHYEGASSGDGVFVIDVSGYNQILLDILAQTITIQAGTRNRELYETAATHGYPFPGGGCPTVGAVGYTLGGGWGYSSRHLGLGCDSVIALKVLRWNGEVIHIDADTHTDLFWLLRGGGCDIGIVLTITYALPQHESIATRVFLDYQFATIAQTIAFLQTYQAWFVTTPSSLNLKAVLYMNETREIGVKLNGFMYADEKTMFTLLADYLNNPYLITTDCSTGPVIEANRWIQDHHPDFESYKSGGRFLSKQLSRQDWLQLVDWLTEIPATTTYAAFTLYGLGGAVRHINHDATAFAFRDMDFIFGTQIVWEEPATATSAQAWVIERWPEIERMSHGSFLNFPLNPQAEANYFGEHYQRVLAIREHYRT